jgi:hypothetical protein
MKYIVVSLLSLVSSVAMADGFRCQGEGYRVKQYNQVQPEEGTRNPAVLVVSHQDAGTLATLEGDEIQKTITEDTVIYEGKTNSKLDGRFMYVKLEVAKKAKLTGPLAGKHLAELTVNADGSSDTALLACKRYRKRDQQ